MINLCNRTEYSFRLAFGLLEKVLDVNDKIAVGICDRNGTWGHVSFEKACKKRGIKPIFGVELAVVNDPEVNENEGLRFLRFIALTNDGLKEIYELVTLSTGQFHYFPRLSLEQVQSLSTNILILTTLPMESAKQNIFLDLNPTTPYSSVQWAIENGIPPVATSDNYYPTPEDENAYGVCMGKFADTKTTPQFILDEWDWDAAVEAPEDFKKSALDNIAPIIQEMNVELPVAELVHPKVTQTLREMCEDGAKIKNIDLSDPEYKERLDRELKLIADKDFEDYFFLIADLVQEAKKTMLVGPARGSSCGSLVCYLIDITGIDPLPYNLLFERFIDVNRADLPDIDIDFPDKKRDQIFDYLKRKYGEECVAQLGTISRFKPKSAIGQVSKELNIPMWEVQELKDAIIERSGGDARASFCIADTFEELEIGQRTLKKYPELIISAELEGHASHSGRHAAGIVVTSNPVSWYCSVDQQTGAAQVDKYDAEDLNLLKIDALGLRTLSVIEDALEQIGWSNKQLIDYRLDDQLTFNLLNEAKWAGIFQFEGYALQSLCHQFTVDKFEDIVALTALARPGPLNSGMANEWIRRKTGQVKVTYDHPMLEGALKTSFGVVVYQEQIMQIAREVGLMSWEDVSMLRKAMSKSMGKEFFDKYRKQFLEGAIKNKFKEEDAIEFWDKINTFGCLSGDTIIKNPHPNQKGLKEITLKELYENEGLIRKRKERKRKPYKNSKEKIWDTLKPMPIHCMHEDGKIKTSKPIQIVQSGEKETFLLKLKSAHSIRATLSHKFFTEQGEWKKLKEIKPGNFIAIMGGKEPSKRKKYSGLGAGAHNVWDGRTKKFQDGKDELKKQGITKCQKCFTKDWVETHHIDFDFLNNDIENLQPVCRKCHKLLHRENGEPSPFPYMKGLNVEWEEVESISDPKMEMTYDICMPDPNHNFVANEMIVHNSWCFNKSHSVAYGMVSYWCLVLKANYPLEYAAACLRNSKDDDQSIKLLRELDYEGYGYKPFDYELSEENWTVRNNTLIGGLIGIKGIGPKTAADIIMRRKEGKALTKRQDTVLKDAKTPYDMIFEGRERWGYLYDNPTANKINSKLSFIRDITNDTDGQVCFIAKLAGKNQRDHNETVNIHRRGGREMTGQTLYLNFTVEDDTDLIFCTIDRWKYLEYGKPIIEEGKIGDWYIFKGNVQKGWRKVHVKRWKKLSV